MADHTLTLETDGEYSGREQIAFTTRRRMHTGDWTGWQVPPQPPSQRGRGLASAILGPIPGPDELFSYEAGRETE